MSKANDESVEEKPKDEQTAKHLHKLAENGKKCGLPASLMAHYEKKAWEATKSDEKHTSCEKCGMPPPPPIESLKKSEEEPSLTCKACGEVNNTPIGLESEIAENIRKEAAAKKQEERRSLKRAADEVENELIRVRRDHRMRSPCQRMARKVAPQPKCFAEKHKTPTLLQPTPSKKAKKAKIIAEKEPEFLQKLFGIGAKSVE